jgi:hypothetical protein
MGTGSGAGEVIAPAHQVSRKTVGHPAHGCAFQGSRKREVFNPGKRRSTGAVFEPMSFCI